MSKYVMIAFFCLLGGIMIRDVIPRYDENKGGRLTLNGTEEFIENAQEL